MKHYKSGPQNCKAWLIYQRICRGLSVDKVAELAGSSTTVVICRLKEYRVPATKRRKASWIFASRFGKRRESKIIEQSGDNRDFIKVELLAYEIGLEQAKRRGICPDGATGMLAAEHNRSIEFVREKLGME